MKKIICLGNRFIYPDNFGILVYEELLNRKLDDIEVIEGGIAGLGLSLHFDEPDSIMLVDYGVGYDKNILSMQELCSVNVNRYDHDTALLYLLKSIEKKNVQMYVPMNSSWNENEIGKYASEIIELTRLM